MAKMNKKAMEPITIILLVVAIAGGLFLAERAGYFAVFTPATPDTALNPYVNKYYYGDATSQSNWECQQAPQVLLRTSFSHTETSPLNPEIAIYEGASTLTNYKYSSASGSSSYWCSTTLGSQNLVYSFGIEKLEIYKNTRSSASQYPYILCLDAAGGAHGSTYRYLQLGGTLSNSRIPTGTNEIVDSGSYITEGKKYACEGNNIVYKTCSNIERQVLETCANGCEFIPQFQFDGGIADIVKCKGTYKPNLELCGADGKTRYTTDASGNINVETCGYVCNSGKCVSCKSGAGRCSGQIVQTCTAQGYWTDTSTTCTGLSQCRQSGTSPDTTASCSSDFVEGQERCSGSQPQVYRSATSTFENKGSACTTSCELQSGRAVCVNQCTSQTCEFGTIFNCNLFETGNTKSQLGTCNSGSCRTQNSCEPRYTLGQSYCVGSTIQTAIPDTGLLSGGVKLDVDNKITCTLGCTDASGTPACVKDVRCTGKENRDVCVDAVTKGTCNSRGDEILSPTTDCTVTLGTTRATCDDSSGTAVCKAPTQECSGNFGCYNGKIYSCINGLFEEVLDDCNNQGCTGSSQPLAQCNDQCTASTCDGASSFACQEVESQDVDGKQKIRGAGTSCAIGCDSASGLCRTECTAGTNKCGTDGYIHVCTSSQTLGAIVDSCNGQGCNTATNLCNDECSTIGYTCSGRNSIYCSRNSTNNQLLSETLTCGSLGCSNGRCVSSNPNSFICIGEALHSTDASGIASQNPLKICSTEPSRNGFQPYCSAGVSDCKACELNSYICGAKELAQCGNEFTGEKINVQSCEAGCINYVCDQASATISPTQNFASDENLIIKGAIVGSRTGNKLATAYTARLTGQGVDKSVSGISTNGLFNIAFGVQPLGDYVVSITIPEYSREISVNSRVTNSYIIKLFGSQVAKKIPGQTAVIQVEALDSKNTAPDDITVSSVSSNITIIPKKTTTLGRWDLEIQGAAGIYNVGLKAVKDSVTLDEQTITIELRKPLLEATSNMPVSNVKGSKSYDINIKGDAQATEPDSISATISHSPAETIALTRLGSGLYTFTYDFSSLGTYTLVVTAAKEGYEFTPFSQTIEISQDGAATPPAGSTQGNTGTTTSTSGTTTTTSTGTKSDNQNLIIIGIVIIIGYFILRGKK